MRRLREGVQQQWQELRAIEQEAEAVATEVGCEDPLFPEVREGLRESRRCLESLASPSPVSGEAIELCEPSDEVLDSARRALRLTAA